MRSAWFIVVLLGVYLPVTGRAAEQVEILRDPWGVPHIFAPSEEQAFFGLGYASAEDRRLQMELVRRKGAGRLAEVFGPEWVQSDREARIAGYLAWSGSALTKLPAEMQRWLTAYAAGVNAWTSAHEEAVARRFQPLGVEPEPWTPADCLLAARATLSLSSPFSDQSVSQYHRFQELVAQGGEAAAEQQFHMAVEDAAAIVSESEMAKDAEAYQRLKNRPRMTGFLLQGTPTDGPKMSHAWAVSGARSKTGKPLLESDPQLPLCTPPFFYEFHLSAGSIDARGVGVPGCPGLFIGFNRHIAWGASALGTGSQAVFLEQLAADGQGYVFAGKTEPFTRRLERIRVKDGPDVVQEVLSTRHGVVFNSLSQNTRPGEAQVLYDPQTMQCGTTVRAMLAFLTANNWTEFRAAMEHYYDPGLHIVYADDQNNIGYQTLVHRPLTARSPRMAQEGWTGQQEIVERIPLDELPHMLNPEQGFISHANNMSVGTWYPFDLGLGTGGNGHTGRSWRLQQLLSGTHLYGVEDFEASVHRDAVNPLLTSLLPIAIKVADEDQVDDANVQRLINAVRGWDLSPATLQNFPAVAALGNVLTPYRGSGLNDSYGAGMGGVTNLARRLAADFARDGATPRGERERAYLKRWLQASAQGTSGRGRGAAATDEWTARMRQGAPEAAGRTITMPYQGMTPLQLPKIDPSLDIVSPPLTCLDTGTIWSQPGNLYTHIVDLAAIDNSRAMIAPGNSEDAASPLRTVGIELWVQGRTRPAPLSRDKVEQLPCTATRIEVQTYDGPLASPALTVDQPDPAARLVAAIPAVVATPEPVPARPRPADAQKPDDPQLEAAFRVILRASGPSNDEVDAQLAEARKYVEGKPELIKQLRGAAVLGIYLIEESAAGRLKVPYGSPYVLTRLRALLEELEAKQPPAPSPAPRSDSNAPSRRNSDIWRPRATIPCSIAESPVSVRPDQNSGTPATLRAAIGDLISDLGPDYPAGDEYLRRLDAIEQQMATGSDAAHVAFAELQREALVASPLVRGTPILFVVREQYAPDHHNTETLFHTGEPNNSSYRPGGPLMILDPVTGQTSVLLEPGPEGLIRDPEVHFDGRKIVFAMRKTRDENYSIYELEVDPHNGWAVVPDSLRRLTNEPVATDIDPVYLSDGSIVFSSTREPKYCHCNMHIMANLHRMDGDGANIHQIGKSTLFEGHASLMPDGRILYYRWEYVDRNFGDAQGLWTVNPDGTGHAVYWANNLASPPAVFDGRAIPGSDMTVCTFGSCHDRPWGAMAIVDRSKGLDSAEAVVRIWPEEARSRVQNVDAFICDHFVPLRMRYEDPFPLVDPRTGKGGKYFLVSRNVNALPADKPINYSHDLNELVMGLYLVDLWGNEVLLHSETTGCFDPMPLTAHPRPPVIPRRRDYTSPVGHMVVADVYQGTHMQGVRRGDVVSLRVVESVEKRVWTDPLWRCAQFAQGSYIGDTLNRPAVSWAGFEVKRILGTVPVEADGSASFEVPAERFVYFQLLDRDGMVISSMRSGTQVQPGETLACIGCHDNRLAIQAPSGNSLALRRPPSELTGAHGATESFNYLQEIQPIWDQHCVRCHDFGQEAESKLVLAGDKELVFNASYVELFQSWGREGAWLNTVGLGLAPIKPAYSTGAHRSRLVELLRRGHYEVSLSADEMKRIVTWIDLGGPYYPDYASAHPTNVAGRAPLSIAQLQRLAALTGLPLSDGQGNPGFSDHRLWVSFDRPDVSPCLRKLDRDSDAYREALAIIQAGQAELQQNPEADMRHFRPCEAHQLREAKYQVLREREAGRRQALAEGRKVYDAGIPPRD